MRNTRKNRQAVVRPIRRLWLAVAAIIAVVSLGSGLVYGAAPLPPNPQSGSVGLEGTISSAPPTQAATITTPDNGRAYTTTPITVNGLCPQGTMVKMFSNNIFVGSVKCSNGSYSIQIDLFSGQNDIVARVFDDLDQAGPDSNSVRVTFNDAQFGTFGSRVTLTSTYAKLGANPGAKLVWPIVISGGTGPYALSVDWGDGKPITLKSTPFAGAIDVDHVYDASGVYRVVVKVTDSKGGTAYLQLIGVANGAIAPSANQTLDETNSTVTVTKTKYSPLPAVASIPLVAVSFWLGRKHELFSLRRRIEESTSSEYSR